MSDSPAVMSLNTMGKRMTMSELIRQRYNHVDLKFFPWLAKVNQAMAKNSKRSKDFKVEQHSHGSSDMGLQVEQYSHGSGDLGVDFFLGVEKIRAERSKGPTSFKEYDKMMREKLALEAAKEDAKKDDHDDALRLGMVLEEGEETAHANGGDDYLEDHQRVINDNAKGQAYPGLEL